MLFWRFKSWLLNFKTFRNICYLLLDHRLDDSLSGLSDSLFTVRVFKPAFLHPKFVFNKKFK